MVQAGAAELIERNGEQVYQMVSQAVVKNGVAALPVAIVITAREMELVAGQAFKYGKSRTAGMTEEQRLTRVHSLTRKQLPAEDAVERAAAKLQYWQPGRMQAS